MHGLGCGGVGVGGGGWIRKRVRVCSAHVWVCRCVEGHAAGVCVCACRHACAHAQAYVQVHELTWRQAVNLNLLTNMGQASCLVQDQSVQLTLRSCICRRPEFAAHSAELRVCVPAWMHVTDTAGDRGRRTQSNTPHRQCHCSTLSSN